MAIVSIYFFEKGLYYTLCNWPNDNVFKECLHLAVVILDLVTFEFLDEANEAEEIKTACDSQ